MYRLIQGNSAEILKQFPDNHFDSIVTDPPYLIGFLGKSWDAKDNFQLDVYQECLRVLKPGGHILAFSAARTYHHLAITLEQAGFEIRDQIMWIYSSGFPKSQDVGKSIDRAAGKRDPNYGTTNNNGTAGGINLSFTEDHIGGSRRCNKCKKDVAAQYDCKDTECGLKYNAQTEEGKKWLGWGTALKPAHEPIALARKPIKQSTAKNVQEYGTGALNIDATRVPYLDEKDKASIDHKVPTAAWSGHTIQVDSYLKGAFEKVLTNDLGRFPSNVIGEIEEEYQKYFYCPKVSRKERHVGYDIEKVPVVEHNDPATIHLHPLWDPSIGKNVYRLKKKILEHNQTVESSVGNNHPTVKPVALMEYLIKLITPPNGIVLDPFNGSGSTGMAAVGLGFDYVGIDLDPNYIEISKRRIDAWYQEQNPNLFRELFVDAT